MSRVDELNRILRTLQSGTPEIVMVHAAPGTLLLVLATAEAKLGLVFLDMRRAVAEITRTL